MRAFMRKFSIFIAESSAILSPVPKLLEGQWVPGARWVRFPKRGIPVSPDSELLKAAQFSRIYHRTKKNNTVVHKFVFGTCPLYWKPNFGDVVTVSLHTVLHYQN